MLACITPLWNMHPPPVCWSHLKKKFEEVVFSSNIIETPKSLRDGAEKSEREKKKKKKKKKSS
jgi:hypothetical protein